MNCRIIYKPDNTVSIIHPAPKARRQLNVDEVAEARAAHGMRLQAQEEAILAREAATNATDKNKGKAEAQALAAEAKVGSAIVIPASIFETDQELLNRVCLKASQGTELEGLPYDDVDSATLPDRKDRDKWRGQKEQGVQIDPSVVTVAERRQAVEEALDVELAKPQPNSVIAIKLHRQLDKRDY